MDNIKTIREQAVCLYSRDEVEQAIDKMALEITKDFSDKNPLLLSVMVGGVVLTGALMQRLDFPLQLDYLHATRYQAGLVGGHIHWKAEPSIDLHDRQILIIDDILDGGITLSEICQYCLAHGAAAVHTAVLLNKRRAREPNGLDSADYCALETEGYYVFGYGMDYKEYLRNAPGIFGVPAAGMG